MEIFKSQDGVLESFDKSEIDEYENMIKKNICSPIDSLQDCWILYYCRDLDDFLCSIAREVGGYCAEGAMKSYYTRRFGAPGVYGFKTHEAYRDGEWVGRWFEYKTLAQLKEMCEQKLERAQEDLKTVERLEEWKNERLRGEV